MNSFWKNWVFFNFCSGPKNYVFGTGTEEVSKNFLFEKEFQHSNGILSKKRLENQSSFFKLELNLGIERLELSRFNEPTDFQIVKLDSLFIL